MVPSYFVFKYRKKMKMKKIFSYNFYYFFFLMYLKAFFGIKKNSKGTKLLGKCLACLMPFEVLFSTFQFMCL